MRLIKLVLLISIVIINCGFVQKPIKPMFLTESRTDYKVLQGLFNDIVSNIKKIEIQYNELKKLEKEIGSRELSSIEIENLKLKRTAILVLKEVVDMQTKKYNLIAPDYDKKELLKKGLPYNIDLKFEINVKEME